MLLLASVSGFAQGPTTVTIGTGTNDSYNLPINNYYKNSWSEMIYPASDITERGYITSIGFDVSSVVDGYMCNTLTIYMGVTSNEAHNSNSDWLPMEALTEVYSSIDWPLPTATGWLTFDLDNPFQYESNDNLVIVVSKTMPNFTSGLKFRYTEGAANCCLYRRNDNNPDDYASHPGANTGTFTNQLPNLQLTFSTTTDFCHAVTDFAVTDISAYEVTFAWNAPENASNYILQYTEYEDWESGDFVTVYPTETPYTLTNLVPNTRYNVRVANVCDNEYSSWRYTAFKTECVTISIAEAPYFEMFEGYTNYAFPDCWTRITGYTSGSTYYPAINNNNAFSGTGSLDLYGNADNPNVVALPQFVEDLNTLRLSFWMKPSSTNNNFLELGVMTDLTDNSTFTLLHSWSAAEIGSTNWAYYEMNLDTMNTPASGHLVFRQHIESGNYFCYLDDVRVMPIPACETPTGLAVAFVHTYSADLVWDDMPGTYNIYYKADTEEDYSSVNNVIVTDNGYELGNLAPETTYYVYLAAVCEDGSEAPSSSSVIFTTLCAPETTPYSEDFNASNSIPNCWEKFTGLVSDAFAGVAPTPTSSGWTFNNTYAFGQYHPRVNIYGTNCRYWLVSPAIDLNGLENPGLTFELALTRYNNDSPILDPYGQADDRFMVLISTDDGVTWSADNAIEWNNSGMGDYIFNQIPATGDEITIPLEQYAGQTIRIAFYGESTVSGGDNDLHIDNVYVGEASTCQRPAQLQATNITTHSAEISWVEKGEANTWTVEYGPVGFTPGSGTAILVSDEPHTVLYGLAGGTEYEFLVTANCSSALSNPKSAKFRTADCQAITLPFTEDFESYTTSTTASTGIAPACWELVQEDVDMTDATRPQIYYKSTFAHSGDYSLLLNYRGVYAMPELHDNIENVHLEMYLRQPNAAYRLQVGVWEDETGAFVPVATFNNSTTNVEFVECDFSDYTGNGRRIAFRNILGNGASYAYSYNYIDDITLTESPLTPASLPYYTDFSEENDQNWRFKNGPCANFWTIGSPEDTIPSALFITQDGTAAGYNIQTASTVMAEKAFFMPATDFVHVEFDVMVGGENGSYDFLKVFLTRIDEMFDASTNHNSQSNASYSVNALDFSDYKSLTSYSNNPYMLCMTNGNTLHISANMPNPDLDGTGKIVFLWRNDNLAGTQPGAVITNFSIEEIANEDVLPPTVTTNGVSDITTNSGVCHGNVTDKGGASMIERGVCWSTSPNPTLEDAHTANGNGLGEFTCQLTDLAQGTIYYVRAYASNLAGTGYGDEGSFTTDCGTLSLPYSDDFESYVGESDVATGVTDVEPVCWYVAQEDVAMSEENRPQLYYNNAENGSYSLLLNYRGIYAMPAISDNIAMKHVKLEMNLQQPDSSYQLQVGVFEIETGTFTPVATFNNSTTEVEYVECDFSSYEGSGRYIAFRNLNSNGEPYSYNYLDDIVLTETEGCELTIENHSSYSYAWNGGAKILVHNDGTVKEVAFNGTDGTATVTVHNGPIELEWVNGWYSNYCAFTISGASCLYYDGAPDQGVFYSTEMDCNNDGPAIPAFSYWTENTCNSVIVHFENESTNAADEAWWDFGDATGEWGYSPTHEYTADGEYVVTVQVNNSSCEEYNTFTQNVTVTMPEPITTFEEITVCSADLPIIWNNMEIYDEGEYSFTLESASGCDSTVFLTLFTKHNTLPYFEDFEGYTESTEVVTGAEPSCWELVQEDVEMTDAQRPQLFYDSNYAYSGDYGLLLNYRGVYAMPPLSEAISMHRVKLEMYLRQPETLHALEVGIWEDDGTFTPVATLNNSTSEMEYVECDFSNYTGNGHSIAFRNVLNGAETGNSSCNYIDNIVLTETEGCTLTFEMHDSYGDGWNGNKILIHNYDTIQEVTLDSGSDGTVTVTVYEGSLELEWVNGQFTNECSFTITGPSCLHYEGSSMSPGVFHSMEMNCESGLPAVPEFTYWMENTCNSVLVHFENTSAGAENVWWDFGNGDWSEEYSLVYEYYENGIYPVTLFVYNTCGNEYSIVNEIEVTMPQPITTIFDTTVCESELPLLWFGDELYEDGNYVYLFETANGCDSTVVLNLNVVPVESMHSDVIGYENEPVTLLASGLGDLTWTDEEGNVIGEGSTITITPTETTTYYVTSTETSIQGNLVVNGDFEQGNTGFNTNYYNNDWASCQYYHIGYEINEFWGADYEMFDHTSGTGLYLMVDAYEDWQIWSQTVEVTPHTNYVFSAWFLIPSPASIAYDVCFVINNQAVKYFDTPYQGGVWEKRTVVWNSGDNTTADIGISTQWADCGGYDFAIDDIEFFAASCAGTESFTVTVVPAGDAKPCPGHETVTDYDGNVYNTVKIGEQCWMKENLRVSHYEDGMEIPLGDIYTFSNDYNYRYIPNGDTNNVSEYGYLYNWAAAMHGNNNNNDNPSIVQGICPQGWHLPSDAEWTQLTDYVSSVSAYLCDEDPSYITKALASQDYWLNTFLTCSAGDNQQGNNTTGFSAVPAGYIGEGYGYGCFGTDASFWSCSQFDNSHGTSRRIDGYGTAAMYDDIYLTKSFGLAVRCVLGEGYNLASVTTKTVRNRTSYDATCGGNVIRDGGTTVTEHGVCWSTEPNPTLANAYTVDGSGLGEFTSQLIDLLPGTTYYVRAYATNSMGTAYGEEVTFTTCGGTLAMPYTEDFESYTESTTAATGVEPSCWELVQEDGEMPDAKRPQLYYNSNFTHSGNYSLAMINRGVYAMPPIEDNLAMKHLHLDMYLRQPNAAYRLQVGVWEDETSTFTPVATFNNSTTGVEHVECDFSNYTGNGRRVAFRNVLGNGANYAYSYNYIDDITLSEAEGCELTIEMHSIGNPDWGGSLIRIYTDGSVKEVTLNNAYDDAVTVTVHNGMLDLEWVYNGWYPTEWMSFTVSGPCLYYSTERASYETEYFYSSELSCDGNGTTSIPDFDYWTENVCSNVVVHFENNSTDAEYSVWDFGDWSSSEEDNPSHEYTVSNVYLVTLSVHNVTCDDFSVIRKYIEVNMPEPITTEIDTVVCAAELPTTWYGQVIAYGGTYSMVLQNALGCDSIVNMNFNVVEKPFLHTPDTLVSANEPVTLWAAGSGNFIWTDADGNVIDEGNNITVIPTESTTYYVTRNENSYQENLVVNGDFEQGDTGFGTSYSYGNYGSCGYYYIGHENHEMWSWDIGDTLFDHTSGTGMYMMVDAASYWTAWSQTVDVTPHTNYVFSAWFLTDNMAYVYFDINGDWLNGFSTPQQRGSWERRLVVWNSGDNTTATININTEWASCGGYDIGIDDIEFYEIACEGTESISLTLLPTGDAQPCPSTPTVSDIDGNVYNTVKIGNQCWMKENLKTTHYADGNEIAWGEEASLTTPYLYGPGYEWDDHSWYVEDYGYLYNWAAVMHGANGSAANQGDVQGICPDGWHVPNNAEWTQLTDYVGSVPAYQCGSSNDIAKALALPEGWNWWWDNECGPGYSNENPSGFNATGFGVRPAGSYSGNYSPNYGGNYYTNYNGNYYDFTTHAAFWSSTKSGSLNAWGVQFFCNGTSVYRYYFSKKNAFSVRCVYDETLALVPTVQTDNVSSIATTYATGGGTVTYDGGADVTERGVCWSIEHTPTVYDNHTSIDGGIGDFTCTLNDLIPGQTYYVRAYATNSVGTAYGEMITFTSNACGPISLPYSENFDGFTESTTAATGVEPDCWELVRTDATSMPDDKHPQLYYKSDFAHSGDYSLLMNYRGVYAMPELELEEGTSVNHVKLEMYLRQSNAAYQLEVGVWDDATNTFEPVALFNNTTTGVEYVTCDFSGYSGNGRRIAFRNTLGNGRTWSYSYNYIDDITLTEMVDCSISELPFVETFENFTENTTVTTGVEPTCWELVRTDAPSMPNEKRPQLYYRSDFAHSGNYSLLMNYRCVYAMPEISGDVPMNNVKLEMYLRQANAAYQLEVGVWDDATNTFEPVALFNNATTGVEYVTCDFSDYSGNGRRIAFRNVLKSGFSYAYSYNYLDDITLTFVTNKSTEVTNANTTDAGMLDADRDMVDVIVYPNPTKDIVNVQCTMNNAQCSGIEIVDMYGKIITTVGTRFIASTQFPASAPTQINVSGLAAGMYFVRVTTDKGVVTKPFVKR